MIDIRFRYVFEDVDRHGNVRVYFWKRPGRKVRIHEPLGSEAFAKRYHELMQGGDVAAPKLTRPEPDTFGWLVARYIATPEFKALDTATQRQRRRNLENCTLEPIAPGEPTTFAAFPLDRMTTKTLAILRDRKADVPEGANNRVKALRAIFRWAMVQEIVAANPAKDLDRLRGYKGGHKPWSDADVAAFERRHPLGSMPRLALSILLYTGMRRSDAVQLGRQHVRDGWISKPQWKGRARHAHRIEIPLLPPLANAIEATATLGLAFLNTSHGKPFSIAGFGNWFRERCDEAGLQGLSAHGLRKAGATRAAEAGATAHQLMAMFGWRSLAEAELYTRAAERKRLARDAMGLIVPTVSDGENMRAEKDNEISDNLNDWRPVRGSRNA